jgi:hypothetical protein
VEGNDMKKKDNSLISKEVVAGLQVVENIQQDIEEEITGFSGDKISGLSINKNTIEDLYSRFGKLGLMDEHTHTIADITHKDTTTGLQVGELVNNILSDDAALMDGSLFSQDYQLTTKKMRENNFIVNYMPKVFRSIKDMVYEVISPDVTNEANFPIEIMNSKVISKEELNNATINHDMDNFLEQTYINAFVQGVEYVLVIPQKEIIKKIHDTQLLTKHIEAHTFDASILEASVKQMSVEQLESTLLDDLVSVDDPYENLDSAPFLEGHMSDLLEAAIRGSIDYTDENNVTTDLLEATFGPSTMDYSDVKGKVQSIMGGRASDIGKKKIPKIKTDGAYISRLEPNTIFPFEINGRVLGYHYLQKNKLSGMAGHRRGFLINNILGKQGKGNTVGAYKEDNITMDTLRQKTIEKLTSVLHRNVSDKFLSNNKSLMPQIMDIFQEMSLYDSNVSVRFIPAKYVESFKINNGVSVLALARIPAKLFILYRLNAAMAKLFEDKDKYVFEVAAGRGTPLHARSMKAIDQFTKVFNSPNDLMDFSKAFRRMSSYNKIVIPVDRDSNSKGFQVNRIEGSYNNSDSGDELRDLERETLSLLDRPQDIIEEMDRLDFAARISATNQSGAMKILKHQKDLKRATNSFLTKWARYEFGNDGLIVRCPLAAPKAIQVLQKQDGLDKIRSKADLIMDIIMPDSAEIPDSVRNEFLRYLVKQDAPYLPFAEWEEYIERIKDQNLVKEQVLNEEE